MRYATMLKCWIQWNHPINYGVVSRQLNFTATETLLDCGQLNEREEASLGYLYRHMDASNIQQWVACAAQCLPLKRTMCWIALWKWKWPQSADRFVRTCVAYAHHSRTNILHEVHASDREVGKTESNKSSQLKTSVNMGSLSEPFTYVNANAILRTNSCCVVTIQWSTLLLSIHMQAFASQRRFYIFCLGNWKTTQNA